MSSQRVGIHIMGSCAGMLIGAAVSERFAMQSTNPYLILAVGLILGFAGGFILTWLLLKLKKK